MNTSMTGFFQDFFQKSLHSCALGKSSHNIRRVNIDREIDDDFPWLEKYSM